MFYSKQKVTEEDAEHDRAMQAWKTRYALRATASRWHGCGSAAASLPHQRRRSYCRHCLLHHSPLHHRRKFTDEGGGVRCAERDHEAPHRSQGYRGRRWYCSVCMDLQSCLGQLHALASRGHSWSAAFGRNQAHIHPQPDSQSGRRLLGDFQVQNFLEDGSSLVESKAGVAGANLFVGNLSSGAVSPKLFGSAIAISGNLLEPLGNL
jgi:hypothetical protein